MVKRSCLMCGRELPPITLWSRLFASTMPCCRTAGLDLDRCWYGFNIRLGIPNPRPRPDL